MIDDDEAPDLPPDFSPSHFASSKLLKEQAESFDYLRQQSFQYMQDGFSIVDAGGVHVDVNRAFCEMTGYSQEELIGSAPDHLYWPPEERDRIQLAFAKTLRAEFADVELIFMRKNGERFPVIVNPFAIRDRSGAITFYAATVKDITQRVKLQSALQESEVRLRGLFESAADAIVILQGENIVDVNERALEVFGVVSLEQLASRASFDFFPPMQPNGEDSHKFSLEKLKAARAGKPQFFAWHHVKLDGTPFEAEVSLSTFRLGELNFTQAIIRDVTQRKQMEGALRESEQRYRSLFENAGDGILIMRGEQILDCNDQVLKIYGISREHLMSLSTYALSPPTQENGQKSSDYFADKVDALQSHSPQIFQWSGTKLDGTSISTEVSLTTLMLDGEPCTQSLIRDVTQRKQLESSLQESEIRYRALFESAGDAIAIMKGEQIIHCNARTMAIYGISHDDLLSQSSRTLFPHVQPDGTSAQELFDEMVEASRTGTPQVYEWHGWKPDGTAVITEISMTTFSAGGEYYEQAISRDITERKRVENALKESEVRYRALFESAGEAIMILKDDQIVDCNEQALALSGRSRDDLLSNTTTGYFPLTQPNGQNSLEFFLEKVAASHSGIPQRFEWTDQSRDGATINTEVSLTAFMIDGVPYVQSMIRDITQRKQLEQALRDSEVRFRTLFENSYDAISILKDSQTIDCNKRLGEMYGLSRDEILSTATGDLFLTTQPNGIDSREFYQEKLAASRAGIPQTYEWYGHKKDGTLVISEFNLTSFVVGGETFEQASGRDITQRKQMEATLVDLNKNLEQRVLLRTDELEKAYDALLQRNVQFRELAKRLTAAEEAERHRIAQLLHDNHQQLLVAAKFKAEMLQNSVYGSQVNDAGRQILEILEQALEVTRSLTMELAPPILYGAGFVVAMQWLARWMEEHHALDVVVIGSLPVTPIPAAVSNLLFRAVRELLFNVVKHARVKQARVNITLADQRLVVIVTDEGVGFEVADALQTPRSYGLFSIQEQLLSLAGRLDISSAPGRGTICTLSIAVADEDTLHPDVYPVADRITTVTADTVSGIIRILVVDDHAMARDAMVQILCSMEDFDVVGEAVDGLDAIEKTRILRPDVVLMDATMPQLNGTEATRRITTEFPGIKVIGLSMHAKEDMQPQMIAAGATCFLQKLSPVEELFAAIRGVVKTPTARTP